MRVKLILMNFFLKQLTLIFTSLIYYTTWMEPNLTNIKIFRKARGWGEAGPPPSFERGWCGGGGLNLLSRIPNVRPGRLEETADLLSLPLFPSFPTSCSNIRRPWMPFRSGNETDRLKNTEPHDTSNGIKNLILAEECQAPAAAATSTLWSEILHKNAWHRWNDTEPLKSTSP